MSFTYERTRWDGHSIYTSLTTGACIEVPEQLVMVKAFDDFGLMDASFKVAYLSEGQVTLKLHLTNHSENDVDVAPWQLIDDGPLWLYSSAQFNPHDDSVGDLTKGYETPAAGKISIWTLKPQHSYRTWRYDRFWGLPMLTPFHPPLAESVSFLKSAFEMMPFFIDGWGHETGGRISRTMTYAAGFSPDDARMLCVKSSNLRRVVHSKQDTPFERFLS